MKLEQKLCLYDKWRQESAPMFHTSAFWPAFDEATIRHFLDGSAAAPEPSRPGNLALAAEARDQIELFLHQIQAFSTADYACKPAYQAFEHERLDTLELILKSHDAVVVAQANDRVFGSLASLHSSDALSFLKHYITELVPATAVAAAARERLLHKWSSVTANPAAINHQFDRINGYRQQFRPIIRQKFSFVTELLKPYSPGQRISTEETATLLQAALNTLFPGSPWRAVTKAGAPNVHISYAEQAIVVPAGGFYAADNIDNLIVHEIGVHVQRSINGAASLEQLAANGMAGYGPIEEAFGVLMGGAFEETFVPVNSLLTFAIIHEAASQPTATFRQLHGFTKDLVVCLANPADEATAVAKDYQYGRSAFSRLMRLCRLGTGQVVERSTTKYWRGLNLLCDYLDNHGVSQAVSNEFLLGKYDSNNPAQLRLIKTHSQ